MTCSNFVNGQRHPKGGEELSCMLTADHNKMLGREETQR
jgi:hypothetical protein